MNASTLRDFDGHKRRVLAYLTEHTTPEAMASAGGSPLRAVAVSESTYIAKVRVIVNKRAAVVYTGTKDGGNRAWIVGADGLFHLRGEPHSLLMPDTVMRMMQQADGAPDVTALSNAAKAQARARAAGRNAAMEWAYNEDGSLAGARIGDEFLPANSLQTCDMAEMLALCMPKVKDVFASAGHHVNVGYEGFEAGKDKGAPIVTILDDTVYGMCDMCEAACTPRVCGGCGGAGYCSAACQKAAWTTHKHCCKAIKSPFGQALIARLVEAHAPYDGLTVYYADDHPGADGPLGLTPLSNAIRYMESGRCPSLIDDTLDKDERVFVIAHAEAIARRVRAANA